MVDSDFKALLAATWPAKTTTPIGPFTYRSNCGGGARVSAATLESTGFSEQDLQKIEAKFATEYRPALFQIWPQNGELDEELAARGYVTKDETLCLTGDPARFPEPIPQQGFPSLSPTAVQREIWAEGGVGAARLAVMERACMPHTTLLGRIGEAPAGTCFIAVHKGIAMVHAVEVSAAHRRHGVAQNMMAYAAEWALAKGAHTMATLVTQANSSAQSLYSGLGMSVVGKYHYRQKP